MAFIEDINKRLREVQSPFKLVSGAEKRDFFFTPVEEGDSLFNRTYRSLVINHYTNTDGSLHKWIRSAGCLRGFVNRSRPDDYQAPTCRICRNCGEKKLIIHFSVAQVRGGKSYWYTECKPCRSDIQNQRYSAARAEKDPHLYVQCDDCSHIRIKFGNKRSGKLRTTCFRCGGKNILPYV